MYGRRTIDLHLLAVIGLLLCVGVLMVFSSSFVRASQSLGDPYYYLQRQVLWLVIGVFAMFFTSQIQYWHWRGLAKPLLIITLILLGLVLVEGIGTEAQGSQRWISFGPVGFQPSEIAKVTLVVYLAGFLSQRLHVIDRFRPIFIPFFCLLGLVFGLIMLQPDMGTALAIAGTSVILLFVAGVRFGYLFGFGLIGVPLAAYLVLSEEYRARRILAFLNPQDDPLGAGYHIIQSLYALGSGGLFGVGFFEGRQKFFYLPAQHTDFIFAVLGEELGFLGTFAVLLLFGVFAWRGFRISVSAPDTFGSLLAAGLTTMVILQAIINIGVVTASLPITGISLPFISYGGSSLVFTLAGMGILLNISKYARP